MADRSYFNSLGGTTITSLWSEYSNGTYYDKGDVRIDSGSLILNNSRTTYPSENFGTLFNLVGHSTDPDGLYYYDGSSWINLTTTSGGGSPGGTDGQLQYNDGGNFNGTSLIWDDSTNTFAWNTTADSSFFKIKNSNGYNDDVIYSNLGYDDGLGNFISAIKLETVSGHNQITLEHSIGGYSRLVSGSGALGLQGNDNSEIILGSYRTYVDSAVEIRDILGIKPRTTYPDFGSTQGAMIFLEGHSTDPDGLYYYNGSSWIDLTRTGNPAGNDGALQYNDNGSFNGTSLIWDDSTNTFAWNTTADSSFFKIQSNYSYTTDTTFFKLGIVDGGDGSFDDMITFKNVYDTATIILDAASSQPVQGSIEGTNGLYLRNNYFTDNYIKIGQPSTTNENLIQLVANEIGFFGVTPVTQPSALTAENTSTVDSTYGTEERDVIENLRTRVNELESKLQNLGLIS